MSTHTHTHIFITYILFSAREIMALDKLQLCIYLFGTVFQVLHDSVRHFFLRILIDGNKSFNGTTNFRMIFYINMKRRERERATHINKTCKQIQLSFEFLALCLMQCCVSVFVANSNGCFHTLRCSYALQLTQTSQHTWKS